MLRFTDAMLINKELEDTIDFHGREEALVRQFFLDRVHEESVASGPYGHLHYRENSNAIGNLITTPTEALYFKAEDLAHREHTVCSTCLSPCQVNVGLMKQFVPYAKFLSRASQVKRDPMRHLETLPTPQP